MVNKASEIVSALPEVKVAGPYAEGKNVENKNQMTAETAKAASELARTQSVINLDAMMMQARLREDGERIKLDTANYTTEQLTKLQEANSSLRTASEMNKRSLERAISEREAIDAADIGFLDNPFTWAVNKVKRAGLERKIDRDQNDLADINRALMQNETMVAKDIQQYAVQSINPRLQKLQMQAEGFKATQDMYNETISGLANQVNIKQEGQQEQDVIPPRGGGGLNIGFGGGKNAPDNGSILLARTADPVSNEPDVYAVEAAKGDIKKLAKEDPIAYAAWQKFANNIAAEDDRRAKVGEAKLTNDEIIGLAMTSSISNVELLAKTTGDKDLEQFIVNSRQQLEDKQFERELTDWQKANPPKDVNGNVLTVDSAGRPIKAPVPNKYTADLLRKQAKEKIASMNPKEYFARVLKSQREVGATKLTDSAGWHTAGIALFRETSGVGGEGGNSYPSELRARGVPDYLITALASKEVESISSLDPKGRFSAGTYAVNLTDFVVRQLQARNKNASVQDLGIQASRLVSDWMVRTQQAIVMDNIPGMDIAVKYGIADDFGSLVHQKLYVVFDPQNGKGSPYSVRHLAYEFTPDDPKKLYDIWYDLKERRRSKK